MDWGSGVVQSCRASTDLFWIFHLDLQELSCLLLLSPSSACSLFCSISLRVVFRSAFCRWQVFLWAFLYMLDLLALPGMCIGLYLLLAFLSFAFS